MSHLDIYHKICNIVTDPEFNEGQLNFFTANCVLFTDDEENKHEYKDIHEQYILLLEKAIEVQLKQEYSEDQMNSFYTDFAENFENYKSVNEDAYEIMCASIDFNKFKDQMLKFKVGVKDEEKSE